MKPILFILSLIFLCGCEHRDCKHDKMEMLEVTKELKDVKTLRSDWIAIRDGKL